MYYYIRVKKKSLLSKNVWLYKSQWYQGRMGLIIVRCIIIILFLAVINLWQWHWLFISTKRLGKTLVAWYCIVCCIIQAFLLGTLAILMVKLTSIPLLFINHPVLAFNLYYHNPPQTVALSMRGYNKTGIYKSFFCKKKCWHLVS